MEDDESILATLDVAPDGFAVFYRRHVAALLAYLLRRTHDPELAADLCAETFAAALDGAHRFDPARGPAVGWLYGIARRQLAHAQRRGAVEDRARRRLRMAPLDLTDAAIERIEALAGSEPAGAAVAGVGVLERPERGDDSAASRRRAAGRRMASRSRGCPRRPMTRARRGWPGPAACRRRCACSVVAAGGDAAAVVKALHAAGVRALPDVAPGVTPQPTTIVHWQPGRATRQDAERVAEVVGADEVLRVETPARTPRPVLDTGASVVVVVGSG